MPLENENKAETDGKSYITEVTLAAVQSDIEKAIEKDISNTNGKLNFDSDSPIRTINDEPEEIENEIPIVEKNVQRKKVCKPKKHYTQEEKLANIKEKRRIKKEQLLYAPTFSLLMKISIPSVISLLIMAAYTIIDSICVAQFSGQPDAVSAMSVFNPIESGVIYSTVIGISVGASNVISLALGREDMEETEAGVSYLFFLAILFSLFLTVLITPLLPILLKLLGADEVTLPLSLDYGYIASGLCIGYVMSSVVGGSMRVMNSSVASMIRLICSSILNALFDVLFMKAFHLGITGAALATASATIIITFSIFIYWCTPRTPMIVRPFPKYIFKRSLNKKYGYLILRILANGLGAGIDPVLRSVTGIIFNNTVKNYIPADDPYFDERVRAAIAAMGTTLRIQQAINSAKGISQAWSGIAATAIGAKNYKRFVRVSWQTIVSLLVFGGTLSCILTSISPQLAELFVDKSNPLEYKLFMEYAVPLLRFGTLSSIFACHYTLTNALFQILGKPVEAFFCGIVSTLFYIPLMFVFPHFYGVTGYRFVILISDLASAVVSLTIMIIYTIKFDKVAKGKGSRKWLDTILEKDEKKRNKHQKAAEEHKKRISAFMSPSEKELESIHTNLLDQINDTLTIEINEEGQKEAKEESDPIKENIA